MRNLLPALRFPVFPGSFENYEMAGHRRGDRRYFGDFIQRSERQLDAVAEGETLMREITKIAIYTFGCFSFVAYVHKAIHHDLIIEAIIIFLVVYAFLFWVIHDAGKNDL